MSQCVIIIMSYVLRRKWMRQLSCALLNRLMARRVHTSPALYQLSEIESNLSQQKPCLFWFFASEGTSLTDWMGFMYILVHQGDGHSIKILMISESDNVILAVHRIIVTTSSHKDTIVNTSPVMCNLSSRRPNPVLNCSISLWVYERGLSFKH